MAAALAGMVSSSAWFTIAQRHKISSIGKQIHPPVVEDDSLARADKKRSISSSELGSQASGSSSSEFIPVKKSKTTTPDDSVPRPATETLEEVFEKAIAEYHEELDKEEQALAQKNEQQNIQAPDEQAEPIPAQQDEQQDTKQADQHALDPLEALLTAHEENCEHQEKRDNGDWCLQPLASNPHKSSKDN